MSLPGSEENSAASVKLPQFWASSLAAWFRVADAQFAIRGVMDPLDQYYLVLGALSEANVDMVRPIVEEEPDATSFRRLREALVSSHILSEYQRIDRLVTMEPLNGRKPSEMLAAMNKLKPADEKQYFAYFFLQRLPQEVRILLSQEPVADLSSRLEGCTVFSKLDLQKGYLQVPVSEEDIPKTAIITPFGLFEFMRMPFGLRNAGMTFQRMMDQIFF
jgi:Reverse transcriptase (RNA-dependent DNA polymerase)